METCDWIFLLLTTSCLHNIPLLLVLYCFSSGWGSRANGAIYPSASARSAEVPLHHLVLDPYLSTPTDQPHPIVLQLQEQLAASQPTMQGHLDVLTSRVSTAEQSVDPFPPELFGPTRLSTCPCLRQQLLCLLLPALCSPNSSCKHCCQGPAHWTGGSPHAFETCRWQTSLLSLGHWRISHPPPLMQALWFLSLRFWAPFH